MSSLSLDDYIVMKPVDVGHRFRGSEPCHIVKLEGHLPEVDYRDYGRIIDGEMVELPIMKAIWNCQEDNMKRFSMEPDNFEFIIDKEINKEYDFDQISEWINTQTISGKWGVYVLADPRRRPNKSILRFFFEDGGDASLFKLFQM